uniref:SUEL-type lectin domain-containing protein n=1 Tax=Arion vulgaris TaxID=1028688 RepID=A0A0B7AUC8_9EUPU
MFYRDVVVVVGVVAAMLLQCVGAQNEYLKTVTACFGNTNNYLRLECENGFYIHVLYVFHSAKIKTAGCIGPFSVDTYRKECCGIQNTDCSIEVQDGASLQCENKTRCIAMATWSNTNKECDQDVFPPNTNYMQMDYMCIQSRGASYATTNRTTSTVSTSLSTTTTSLPPTTTSSSPKPSSSSSSTVVTTTSATIATTSRQSVQTNASIATTFLGKTSSAAHSGGNKVQQEDELSDAMIGAIVGGCLGMLFTFVVFVFYWGRKRRLRIVGKPQPTVWDYLLSQTFTVRGSKGYDHFSSVRSSASSEGDPSSPGVRKNMWLPNIVDRDYKVQDDVISNYDNDSGRYHRVEIHHNSTPSPYAILNLHVNNLQQESNHEA